jgi:hypothetical protein
VLSSGEIMGIQLSFHLVFMYAFCLLKPAFNKVISMYFLSLYFSYSRTLEKKPGGHSIRTYPNKMGDIMGVLSSLRGTKKIPGLLRSGRRSISN